MKPFFLIKLVLLVLIQGVSFAQSSERVYVWTAEEEGMDIYKSTVGDTIFVMEKGYVIPLVTNKFYIDVESGLEHLPPEDATYGTLFLNYSYGSYQDLISNLFPEIVMNNFAKKLMNDFTNPLFEPYFTDCNLDYKPFVIESIYFTYDPIDPEFMYLGSEELFTNTKLALVALQRYLVKIEGKKSSLGFYTRYEDYFDDITGAPEYNGNINGISNVSEDGKYAVVLSAGNLGESLLHALLYANEIVTDPELLTLSCENISSLDSALENLENSIGFENPILTSNEDFYINSEDLYIYPNPVSDMLYIKTSNKNNYSNVKVYDSSSRLVFQNNHTSINEPLDLNFLREGVYILQFLDLNKNKVYSKKFFKR